MLRAAYNVIVVGAGAAGLYCAMHAARRGKRVLVLEHSAEIGAKILISGGGRCNFTNLNADDPERYLSANPHFARSALARHTQDDFIALVRTHGISYYEKTLGQLFCEGARSSQKIVRMLLDECAAAGADLRTGCRVTSVRRGDRFIVDTDQGAFTADKLVVATGGLSIPKLGATAFAFDLAEQFAIPIVATRPGLVPLTFAPRHLQWMQMLSGVSTEVVASIGRIGFREAALFTHRGLSGPAILQISSYWTDPTHHIGIDWLPDAADDVLIAAKRARPLALPKTAVAVHVPERLAAMLMGNYPPRPLGEWKDEQLIAIARRKLKGDLIQAAGTEGYAKAEVTVGGIDTDALSQQTMECLHVPGLYFIGEAVDVTGWLGGYNFQWAWSSGWAAAQSL
jgi:predicted Rossmann fold flavoprotein